MKTVSCFNEKYNRQLDRQIDGSLDCQIARSLDRQIDGSLDQKIVRSLERWIVRSLDRWIVIIKSLSLKKCLEISVSPNRENIKLLVLKVTSEISVNFTWLATALNEKNIACLWTLLYVRDYKTCGELYQFFMSSLLDKAYHPYGAEKKCTSPQNGGRHIKRVYTML